jgi:GNAT superfamily N-acetyltransferase
MQIYTYPFSRTPMYGNWTRSDMSEITIAGYVPGAIGRVAELHATYYSQAWDFGLNFEAQVASELSEFLRRFDPARDGFWTANRSGRVEGSIAIDGARAETEGAHLRWFILSDALRGLGVGNLLLQEAVGFCGQRGYSRVFLWTFHGLDSARHLYEKIGFRLADEIEGEQWGKRVLEQRFVLVLA